MLVEEYIYTLYMSSGWKSSRYKMSY